MITTPHELIQSFAEKYRPILVYYCPYDYPQTVIEYHSLKYAASAYCTWYMFVGHKWTQTSYFDVLKMIADHITDIQCCQFNFEEIRLLDVCNAFENTSFVDRMNMNHNLICFKNGVYDIQHRSFRDGVPDDYCTLSTGYDYVQYDSDTNTVSDIDTYISSMYPNENDKTMFLEKLAKIFTPDPEYRFDIICGDASVITLLRFIREMLGDYTKKLDRHMPSKHMVHTYDAKDDINNQIQNVTNYMLHNHDTYKDQRCSNVIIMFSSNLPTIANDPKYVREIIHLTGQLRYNAHIIPMFMDLVLKYIDDARIFESMSRQKSAM